MHSIDSFTDMLMEFAENLCALFPKDKKLRQSKSLLAVAIKADGRAIMEAFMNDIRPYTAKIQAHDGTVFEEFQGGVSQFIDLGEIWNRDLSPKTRDSIWQYLNTLMTLGSIISSVPSEILEGAEKMAEKFVQDGGMDMSNFQSLIQNMGNLLKQ